MNTRGFWGTIDWFYWNWDGRAISPIYWARNLMLWVVPYNFSFLNSFLALSTLFYSSVLIFKIISNHGEKLLSKYSLKFSGILFCFLWISFSAHMSRSIYWATGSFYVYSTFGLILFIFLLATKQKINWILLLLLFSFGLTGINISILMTLFILYIFYFTGYNYPKNDFFWILGICLASFFLVFVAPGNYKRGAGTFEFEISNILFNYFSTLKEFALMFKWGFLTSLLFSVMVKNNNYKVLQNASLFLFLAGVYLLPFALMDGGAPKHTAITFHILLWISLFYFFGYFVNKFNLVDKLNVNYLVLLFLFYMNFHLIHQFILGREIKSKVENRYAIFKESSGSKNIIYLEPISIQELNHTNRFWDMSTDPNDPFNWYLKEYFDLYKIVMIPN